MTTEKRTAGAQFTLFPMSGRFVDIILGALDEVDTANTEMKTDNVSTEIRGTAENIFDVMQAVFLHAAKTGEHVALSGTATMGCPGGDACTPKPEVKSARLNQESISKIDQKAGVKFSLYPLGDLDYMKKIETQIDLSSDSGVEVTPALGATRLDGDAKDIFRILEKCFTDVSSVVNHTAMAFTISANSPSERQ